MAVLTKKITYQSYVTPWDNLFYSTLGCIPCWCSGVANDCSLAAMYWSTMRLQFFDDNHEVTITKKYVKGHT